MPVWLRAGISDVQQASPAAPLSWMPTTAPDAIDQPARARIVGIAEAQRVENGDGPRPHREDVAQDAADAGGRALEGLDERRMIVALHLEDHGPAVADVDGPRVLAGALEDTRALGGQPGEEDARVLVGAVLRPQRREQPELRVARLAAEALDDAVVFVGGEPELAREAESGLGFGPRHYRLRKLPSSTRVPRSDWKIRSPSVPPIARSAARSGCGIRPRTVPSSLLIPAMFSSDPLGLAAFVG